MIAPDAVPRSRRASIFPVAALLAGFTAAVLIRLTVGGPGVARSAPAGLGFAACLVLLSAAAGTALRPSWRAVLVGALGGVVLCLPPLLTRAVLGWTPRPGGSYLSWALVVTIVAVAEEVLLRGALYDAVIAWRGEPAAIAVAAVAFAALHVPLYGWHVALLDLTVGVWLGALRSVARSPTAPAVAHVVADLAGWWLR